MSPQQVERVVAVINEELDRRLEVHARALKEAFVCMKAIAGAVKQARGGAAPDPKDFDKLFDAVSGYVARNVRPLAERVGELEHGRTMKFAGPYDPSQTYPPGSVVQRQSSSWVALTTTKEAPGQSADWRRIGSAT